MPEKNIPRTSECGTRCTLRPPRGGREWEAVAERNKISRAGEGKVRARMRLVSMS
ncbi:hypothetical protein GCM10010387_18570 [Streptomyces inusitatus]|uniref:Uncharacterized protein n=1 Tax=Streptomyces inusitatus TaxID=68221 RepID=A0A918PWG3_9ACTN|nr:hypothetical protein [Streptomyces inusitatus]GGZ25337.1 hypothetical protein GCM10010387_18570 [Streptomyces inusitatus]